ncbi:hypothetical protein ABIA99_007603 [Bradyrhizobium sp. LB12.1]
MRRMDGFGSQAVLGHKPPNWGSTANFLSALLSGHAATRVNGSDGPIADINAWHPVKACLALPSDPSYSVLWVG